MLVEYYKLCYEWLFVTSANVFSPTTSKKRKGSMGLLSATDCLINTNVLVFRESQQRNYTFMSKAHRLDVLSLTPLPKVYFTLFHTFTIFFSLSA